ncbi:MAG: MipA/OmpV family protein [Roseateles sp.]|uniref:MipA/OmpV family protein n=1 Tax=Roseateles sp. TaxID=1971397 RepID=UPI004035C4E5
MTFTARQRLSLLLVATLMAGPAAAENISRELRRGESTEANHLELGLGLLATHGPKLHGVDHRNPRLVPILSGRYEWKGVFVELGGSDRLGLGYSLVDNPNWSLELLLNSNHAGTRHEGAAWKALDTKADHVAGLRLTANRGDYVWQLHAWKDVSGRHNGFGGSVQLGRAWQLGNWNLHALAGVGYGSAKTMNYFNGVTAQQAAATGLAEYRAGGGVGMAAEVGASYPLARSWVLRSTLRVGRIADSVADSSRWREKQGRASSLMLGLSYVF